MLQKERLDNLANEVWQGAIALRSKFKAREYSAFILPMILLRRIECVLEERREEYKQEIVEKDPTFSAEHIEELQKINPDAAKEKRAELFKRIKIYERTNSVFYNESDWSLKKIIEENATQVDSNFRAYLKGFSDNVTDIMEHFNYSNMISQMARARRLSSIIRLVSEKDFGPERLSNLEMGYVYEHLLQKFSEDDAKDTGEHFTPREIIRIMVELLEIDFDPESSTQAISIYDPACGTGGMLSVAKEHLVDKAKTEQGISNTEDLILLSGQELLPQNYAICKADMLIKGDSGDDITLGNSLIPHIESVQDDGDQHTNEKFDYMLSNPPFGVNWSEYQNDALKLERARYRAGTPDVGDGALLFLLTMIEKMKPKEEGGSKIAILFNGSPLSNGDALQGESEIRRFILEQDLLDTIVMLPDQMFYNTGIYTYIWILNNNKPEHKKDHALIINARDQFEKEPKSFGNKRNRISDEHRTWIDQQFEAWEENEHCKIFHRTDFAFHKVHVVFWQEDEHGKQEWIEEEFGVKLNSQNVTKKFDLYGDFKLSITLKKDGKQHDFEIHYTGKEKFDPIFRKLLKETFPELKGEKASVLKAFADNFITEALYYHRNYIVDTEYIPFDRNAEDKTAFIKDFLNREIDYEIITWDEVEQLGYEILPNKYFYKYEEPTPSEELIAEFWQLEKEAESLLQEIREL
ncbi:MAG: N-6 DNA methylase [Balneolaceae bacterium]